MACRVKKHGTWALSKKSSIAANMGKDQAGMYFLATSLRVTGKKVKANIPGMRSAST